MRLVKKILFMEPPNSYPFCEGGEANLFVHLQNEIPVHEITATRIIIMGRDPKIMVSADSALELLSQLYFRAANLQLRDSSVQVLALENPSIIGNLLQLAAVANPSEGVTWLSNELYWKACLLLLIMAAFNPRVT